MGATRESVKGNVVPRTDMQIPIKFSQSKIDEMRKIALELSKKIGESKQIKTNMSSEFEEIYGPDGELLPARKEEQNSVKLKGESMKIDTRIIKGNNSHVNVCNPCSSHSLNSDYNHKKPYSRKHKSNESESKIYLKKDKYSNFEGIIIPHLVKYKKVKKSKVQEKPTASQNDYVLRKLFSKSGL